MTRRIRIEVEALRLGADRAQAERLGAALAPAIRAALEGLRRGGSVRWPPGTPPDARAVGLQVAARVRSSEAHLALDPEEQP